MTIVIHWKVDFSQIKSRCKSTFVQGKLFFFCFLQLKFWLVLHYKFWFLKSYRTTKCENVIFGWSVTSCRIRLSIPTFTLEQCTTEKKQLSSWQQLNFYRNWAWLMSVWSMEHSRYVSIIIKIYKKFVFLKIEK